MYLCLLCSSSCKEIPTLQWAPERAALYKPAMNPWIPNRDPTEASASGIKPPSPNLYPTPMCNCDYRPILSASWHLLEQRVFRPLWFLLRKERCEFSPRAGVAKLGGWLRGSAGVLHIQIFRQQHLGTEERGTVLRHTTALHCDSERLGSLNTIQGWW